MPTRTISQDEHYITDIATQQDGVPQETLALLLPYSTNLPTDYDRPPLENQPTSSRPTESLLQSDAQGATAQQSTGETFSVPTQEGRYRDIV